MEQTTYLALTQSNLASRLSDLFTVTQHLGNDPQTWQVKEVGEWAWP